jgi:hypothetical protein
MVTSPDDDVREHNVRHAQCEPKIRESVVDESLPLRLVVVGRDGRKQEEWRRGLWVLTFLATLAL